MHAGAVKEARVSFTAFFSEIVLYKIYKKLNEKLCKSDVAKVPGGVNYRWNLEMKSIHML